MIPGEIITSDDLLTLNEGLETVSLDVANTGDRPIQVGFDREKARGWRLDIPSGTAVRFEPGQTRSVTLVPYQGNRIVIGFNGRVDGALEARVRERGAKEG